MNEPGSGYETRFSDAVATPTSRAQLINSLLAWLDTHKLDGCVRARQRGGQGRESSAWSEGLLKKRGTRHSPSPLQD